MRTVLQRVRRASVRVDGEVVGEVGVGFLALLGVTHGDTPAGAEWMADKVVGLRVFPDGDGKMNLSLADVGGGLLVVSQFTLYGDCSKGRRPSFVAAARPESAEPLYEAFLAACRGHGIPTQTGRFGADMAVELVNDGPVTLVIDSPPPAG